MSRLAVPRQAGQPDQELPESPGQSALHLQRGVQEGGERPGGERLHQGPLRQDTGREALGVLQERHRGLLHPQRRTLGGADCVERLFLLVGLVF